MQMAALSVELNNANNNVAGGILAYSTITTLEDESNTDFFSLKASNDPGTM